MKGLRLNTSLNNFSCQINNAIGMFISETKLSKILLT